MKKNEWDFTEDPLSYLNVDPSNYVQYTQTIFSKAKSKTLSFKNGVVLRSIDQTQISEFDIDPKKLMDYGYEVAPQLVDLGNRCSKTGYFQKCDCDTINFKPKYAKGINHKRICPICNRARAKSLGRTKFLRTWALKPDYVVHLVLTLPDTHPKYTTSNTKEFLQDTTEYLFSMAKAFIEHFFKGYGFDAKVHTWKSSNPLSYPHWHIHCIIPLVKIQDEKIIQKNGHVPKSYLDVMREYWAQLIGWNTPVNINYSFARTRDEERTNKIRHWYNYIARGAICDINEWYLEHPNKKHEEIRVRWFRFHTDPIKPNFKELRSFGILAECNIKHTLLLANSSLEIVHDWIYREKKDSKRLYCFHCYEELNPIKWKWHEGFIPRIKFAKCKDRWTRYSNLTSALIDTSSLPLS